MADQANRRLLQTQSLLANENRVDWTLTDLVAGIPTAIVPISEYAYENPSIMAQI